MSNTRLLLTCISLWGCASEPVCEGPERDNCLASLATTEMATDARRALETARGIEDNTLRELAIVNVLTRSSAFDGHTIQTLCHAEVRSAALRKQCDYALERPHLGVAEPKIPVVAPDNAKPLSSTSRPDENACVSQPDSDACLFEQAARLQDPQATEALLVLSKITNPELRGRAACSTLRAATPDSMVDLNSWTPVLTLVSGIWAEEAASVLGTEHVARVARACSADPRECDQSYRKELLPFAIETCASTNDTSSQCFDHICGLDVELTLKRHRNKPAPELADLLRRRHRLALAADPRIGSVRSCMATWFGRKLMDGSEPDWARERCAALGEEAQACLASIHTPSYGGSP
ncbi:MAG: hypothetical protein VX519_04160 [Myxococcota bacterium]|nr:hypothetical protein [Myxococcota bacterium]